MFHGKKRLEEKNKELIEMWLNAREENEKYFLKGVEETLEGIKHIEVALRDLKRPHSSKDCVDVYQKLQEEIIKSRKKHDPDCKDLELRYIPVAYFPPYSEPNLKKSRKAKEYYTDALDSLKERITKLDK